MKISLLCHNCLPFDGNSLNHSPLGGTETGAIHLTRELQNLGHTVKVFTPIKWRVDNYYPATSIAHESQDSDIVISVRDYKALAFFPQAKARLFWTGDSYDQTFNVGMGDRRAAKTIDLFLAVSEWHRQTLCEASGFPLEKSWVIKNGIDSKSFADSIFQRVQKNQKRLIYSSMPYRGFIFTPNIYRKILERIPDAEFHAFTGYRCVQNLKTDQQQEELDNTVEELQKLPGFVYHGNVNQSQLAVEFMKSGVLFYPNIFEETSCITAIEAMAGGCVPVTTTFGALPETIANTGMYVTGHPMQEDFADKFATGCCTIMNASNFEELSNNCRERGMTYSWSSVASNLVIEIGTRFNVH